MKTYASTTIGPTTFFSLEKQFIPQNCVSYSVLSWCVSEVHNLLYFTPFLTVYFVAMTVDHDLWLLVQKQNNKLQLHQI